MFNLIFDFVLPIIAIAVPVAAFVWEFVVVGSKRLGARVQLDTTAADLSERYSGAWKRVDEENGGPLRDPTFVLLRIENNGFKTIAAGDYAVPATDPVGVRVEFPGRHVAGFVISEFSRPGLKPFFDDSQGSGLGMANEFVNGQDVGVVKLPRVTLIRGDFYKVLVVLERAPNNRDEFEDPRVIATIVGGRAVRKTRYRPGPSRRMIALVGFLMLASGLQLVNTLTEDGVPLDCAAGELTVTGSTALAPVLQEAAALYDDTCPGASFKYELNGSVQGLRALDAAGRKAPENLQMLAFSDGPKPEGFPNLLPRPAAFSLFTMVIHKEAGVQDLTLGQIRQIYAGQFDNWQDVGGNDLPIRLVSRDPDSGTRKTFQQQILLGKREAGSNSDDCLRVEPGGQRGVVRCQRRSTEEVLSTVAGTPGALGYSELGAAADRTDLLPVRIDGRQATLEGALKQAYPFWQTEYAYTYGEPKADSLAASFLRYLTNEVGQDVIRSYSHRPCSELDNAVLCYPA